LCEPSAERLCTHNMRVIVTKALPGPVQAKLDAQEGLEVLQHTGEDAIPRETLLEWASKGVSGIYCMLTDRIDKEVLDAAGPSLRVVSTMSVGFNHIDVASCKERGIAVGFTPDVLTETTADLAVGLVVSVARRFAEAAALVKEGGWHSWNPLWLAGKDVHGSTVGVFGMGRIGQAIARRLKGFGCRILYTGRSGPKTEVDAELGSEFRSFEAMLGESDFVVIACALSDETRGVFGHRAFSCMKRDAVLVNIARGEIVDQEALIAALERGEIGGAGLDVTTPEPLPADSPLLSFPNVLVLPHIGSASVPTREMIASIGLENLLAGVHGIALPKAVPGCQLPPSASASSV
jgi:glyoxylate/hydroxypyruvate reductase